MGNINSGDHCVDEGHEYEHRGSGPNERIVCRYCMRGPTGQHILELVRTAEAKRVKARKKREDRR